MKKRKQGEKEALEILKNLEIEMNEDYYDDNSSPSMPDLKYADGRGIEVTHTRHNNDAVKKISKYDQIQPGEENGGWIQRHLKMEMDCRDAYDRVEKLDYECSEDGYLTPDAYKKFNKDCDLLRSHMGYDPRESDPHKRNSEFKCDRPFFEFSIDNILYEITDDKGKKHSSGDTDLFLFVTEEEFKIVHDLIPQRNWNGTAICFLNSVLNSPFPAIYICSWDFENQKYDVEHPKMIKFYKDDGALSWKWFNMK